MSASQLCAAVENAISQVVADFQNNPDRFWNERDIHWSLFHYVKREEGIKEAYPTQLIRAELPTLKVFDGNKPARGHYDLVILDAESYFKPEVQSMKRHAPWEKYLKLVQITVAIEVKLWLNRLRPENMAKRADWDIKKLTDKPNKVQNAYFLNLVQLEFKPAYMRSGYMRSEYMRDYYNRLREYLSNQKKKWPDLNILCVPSDPEVQLKSDNWL
jgi:hypothetical protein